MDRKVFEKLQAHVFDEGNPWDIWADGSRKPNRLPCFSSWAIYGENDLENKEVIPDKVISSLNGSIVFVGLNFSSPLQSWGPWKNIHNHPRVRWLLNGEDKNFDIEKVQKYKGAYITDIIKNIIGPVAQKVISQLDREKINKNIGWFFEEIDLLGSDSIEMYLLGAGVETLFKDHVLHHEKFPEFSRKVKKIQRIDHYGNAHPYFERNAPTQLGLASNPEAKIYRPLWPRSGRILEPVRPTATTKKPKPVQGTDNFFIDEINRIREFFEDNGFVMNAPAPNGYYVASQMHNGLQFCIEHNNDRIWKFFWVNVSTERWANIYDRNWFDKKGEALRHKDGISGSRIVPQGNIIPTSRLYVEPVDQKNFAESLLKIAKESKGTMGY